MEEPKYMTVQDLKDELGKYPSYLPVVSSEDEFITTTEDDIIEYLLELGMYGI